MQLFYTCKNIFFRPHCCTSEGGGEMTNFTRVKKADSGPALRAARKGWVGLSEDSPIPAGAAFARAPQARFRRQHAEENLTQGSVQPASLLLSHPSRSPPRPRRRRRSASVRSLPCPCSVISLACSQSTSPPA